jgi:guanine nucleotide-binding protein subunit alpha
MSTEDKEGKARNEEIENQLKRDKMLQRNEIKMLLLGMITPGYTWKRDDHGRW